MVGVVAGLDDETVAYPRHEEARDREGAAVRGTDVAEFVDHDLWVGGFVDLPPRLEPFYSGCPGRSLGEVAAQLGTGTQRCVTEWSEGVPDIGLLSVQAGEMIQLCLFLLLGEVPGDQVGDSRGNGADYICRRGRLWHGIP